MTRITPRTCLWPLTGSLLATFALSLGLTFRQDAAANCFAGVCGEHLFPLQTRLHVLVWYLWISLSVTFLAVRAFSSSMQKRLRRPLLVRKLPIIGKHLNLSGALALAWVLILYGVVVGIWWLSLRDYFQERGYEAGIESGGGRLAAVALTGHICDITTGMIILPVSRHSALVSFFKLSVSTTLAAHMIAAYILFFFILLHGFLYVAWLPVFDSLSATLRRTLPVLNPTYLYNETWPGDRSALGVWRASLIFTGLLATILFFVIFLTTLPAIRKRHFNIFYFFHLLGIVAIVAVCLHASTMFYCTAPGLAMWTLDWAMRFYELRRPLSGSIASLGRGWFTITIPLPRHRLDGCACKSPLAHFYIYHSGASIRELHPFTTITHLATQNEITPPDHDSFPIQFLFRKSQKAVVSPSDLVAATHTRPLLPRLLRKMKRPKLQWTNQMASLVEQKVSADVDGKQDHSGHSLDDMASPSSEEEKEIGIAAPRTVEVDLNIRLEGPYFTPADPSKFNTVVCFVAGTGISGAIAIAGGFSLLQQSRASSSPTEDIHQPRTSTTSLPYSASMTTNKALTPPPPSAAAATSDPAWRRCIVVWSVRESDVIEVPFLSNASAAGSALQLQTYLTGPGRPRLDLGQKLAEIREEAGLRESTWVYLSGPDGFIAAGERACKEAATEAAGAETGKVEHYGARWSV